MQEYTQLKTIFSINDSSIAISHTSCTSPSPLPQDSILLVAEQCTPNTLTQIEVTYYQEIYCIYVYWEQHTSTLWFDVLLNTDSNTLFIGAGTLATIIDLPTLFIRNQHTIELFWGFERRGHFVVEFGELQCFLYDQVGVILDQVPVDPPYEYTDFPEGIRFESIIFGTQWLYYPPTP